MDSKERILKILGELKVELNKRYKVRRIGLFGSYVKGREMTKSDIDLLVDFEDTADFLDLVGLGLFLEEKFNQKIDIVPQRAVREELREIIFKEVSFV